MKKIFLSILLVLIMQIPCQAASGPQISPPIEQGVANGAQNCVQNIASCTNTSELQSAFVKAMGIAKVSLDNFVDYVYQLLDLAPLPTAPSQPGMPSVADTPVVKVIPCPQGSTPTTCNQQP